MPRCPSVGRPLRRIAAAGLVVLAALAPGCGGGGGGDEGLPVSMTLTAAAVNAHEIDVSWTPLASAPTRYALLNNANKLADYPSNPNVAMVSGFMSARTAARLRSW